MFGVTFDSLRDVWHHTLEKFPDKTAAIHAGRAHTYRQCHLLSDRLRKNLAERFGLAPGQTVAIAAPNGLEYYLAYWAVLKSGGIVVPLNTRLSPPEIADLLHRSQARILIIHKTAWPLLADVLDAAPRLEHIIGIGLDNPRVTPLEQLLAQGPPSDFHPPIAPDDLAVVMFTSGTTGRPKGAVMRHGDLLFNNRLAIYAHGLRHQDIHLLAVPMFHPTALYSLLPTSALLGAAIVLAPRPEPAALAKLIQDHRVTTFFGVPALLRLLTVLPDLHNYHLDSLRLIAYAGAAMPTPLIRSLRRHFPRVALHNYFGLTETISMTHVLPDRDADTHPQSVGKLLPHVRQRILDSDGRPLPPGEIGELHFHRSNVISAYWQQPHLLEKSMRGDWYNTRDLALEDPEGYLYLKGRSKDMIIVGGENVYAIEIENCLLTHPGIADVAVIGIPATGVRAHLGELIKAHIVPQPGVSLTESDIKRHCHQHIAPYKTPQIIQLTPHLPRNPAGKILKRLLK